MMDPRNISINDYTYLLPDEKIAKYPLAERDESKLLIYHNAMINDDQYLNIDQYLPEHSLMIFNNTKVVEARLIFEKPTGARIEIFCLEPSEEYPDITTALLMQGTVKWNCLIGGASKWKPGQILEKQVVTEAGVIHLKACYLEKKKDSFLIQLSWTPERISFSEILHLIGNIPLPPYIKRSADSMDAFRYQTIYAVSAGSVAAPTAGLHFTENIFDKLDSRNIERERVTLHVGAGTFKPVKSETMVGHEMHAEFIDVNISTIQKILSCIDKPLVCVGTTSLRTVETLYWTGVKIYTDPSISLSSIEIDQWYVYEEKKIVSPGDAMQALIKWMENKNMARLITKTSILIAPGYRIRMASALVTNFHQPNSTLLLLVAAFIGDDWRKVYAHALKNDYRFLSYGDGCLLFRQ